MVNTIIGKHKNTKNVTDYITLDGIKKYNLYDINEFSIYFIKCGQKKKKKKNQANKIPLLQKSAIDYLQRIL